MTQFMDSTLLHPAQPNILMLIAVYLHVTACRLVEPLPKGRRRRQQTPHPPPLFLLSAVTAVSTRRSAQTMTKFSLLITLYSTLSLLSKRSTIFYITIHCLPFSPVCAQ